MSALEISLDLSAWSTSARELRTQLNTTLHEAVRRGAQMVAETARADHPYVDRTGNLTRSIRSYAPRGTFLNESLRAEVIATERYASYLERRQLYAFLAPALGRSEGRIEHDLHDALEAAVERAGMK